MTSIKETTEDTAWYSVPAQEAARRLRKAGVERLPWPEVGRPYDFTLTTTDGKRVRARDLRGKVVLIDCWATGCSPCLAKMQDLKALYEKHHEDGLEVLGVCFDEDGAKARKTVARLGLAWPQVLVPADEVVRDLWQVAAGMRSLKRRDSPAPKALPTDGALARHLERAGRAQAGLPGGPRTVLV